jgi:alanine racemase
VPRPTSVRRWVEISTAALDSNGRRARERSRFADLRADAYGHGLALVAERLDAAGFEAFVVSPDVPTVAARHLRTPFVSPAQVDAADLTGPELYGAAPGWQPVLRVGAEILAVKDVPAGEGVSYGYTYVTERDTRLALIGAGYAHGVVRRASNRAPVLVGGAQRIIAGVISMDQLTVDLAGADAAAGDDAVFFGDPERGEPALTSWAEATGIRALAITARLSDRLERRIT